MCLSELNNQMLLISNITQRNAWLYIVLDKRVIRQTDKQTGRFLTLQGTRGTLGIKIFFFFFFFFFLSYFSTKSYIVGTH